MKICLRYLSPKSPFSERGLTIATLKILSKYVFCFVHFPVWFRLLFEGEGIGAG